MAAAYWTILTVLAVLCLFFCWKAAQYRDQYAWAKSKPTDTEEIRMHRGKFRLNGLIAFFFFVIALTFVALTLPVLQQHR